MNAPQRNRLKTAITTAFLLSCHAVTVTKAQTIFATYDDSFGAPRCMEASVKCDSGDALLTGVGSFETNSPNTIDGCVDYSYAVNEQDEYNMKLKVRNVDGLVMSGGQNARITSLVNTASDTSGRIPSDESNVAHFYYASNATAANWEHLATRTRNTGYGQVNLHLNFRLADEGGIHAIRVSYGYGQGVHDATNQACASDWVSDGSSYIDVDDLVFYVSPPLVPTLSPSPSSSPTISSAPTTSTEPSAVSSTMPSSEPSSSPTIPTLSPVVSNDVVSAVPSTSPYSNTEPSTKGPTATSNNQDAQIIPTPEPTRPGESLPTSDNEVIRPSSPSTMPSVEPTSVSLPTEPAPSPSTTSVEDLTYMPTSMPSEDGSLIDTLLPFLPNSSMKGFHLGASIVLFIIVPIFLI